jgi:hypothetical protein
MATALGIFVTTVLLSKMKTKRILMEMALAIYATTVQVLQMANIQ